MRARPAWLVAVSVLTACSVQPIRFVTGDGGSPGDDGPPAVNCSVPSNCSDPACAGAPDCMSMTPKPECGNGIVEAGEQCDDGNMINGDACDNNCTVPACGNGIVDPGEQCDLVPQDLTRCTADCKLPPASPLCGDGIVEAGEECDTAGANRNTGDCRLDCQLNRCGDGYVDMTVRTGASGPVEQCDAGPPAAAGSRTVVPTETATCNIDCTLPRCGDGEVNRHFTPMGAPGPEQCDNGANNSDHAACTARCQNNFCGDGLVYVGVEQCDDGASNGKPGDSCSSTCTIIAAPVCGNGMVDQGEVCDDGTLNGSPCDYNDPSCVRCNSTCSGMIFPGGPFCGDGLVQSQFGEQCDPGSGALSPPDTANCDSDCTLPVCGDGHVNALANEVCDDNNNSACGQCSANCSTQTPAAPATGTLLVSDAAEIRDGDTFTLSDGFRAPAIFQFTMFKPVTAPAIPVALVAGDTDATVATKIANAVGGASGALDIKASTTGNFVHLTNLHGTVRGNQPITTTVTSGLTVGGMAGGVAGNCNSGVGCTANGDCGTGTCTAGHCQ